MSGFKEHARAAAPLIGMLAVYFLCITAMFYIAISALQQVQESGGFQPLVNQLWCGKESCDG